MATAIQRNRVEVDLPIKNGYQSKWEELGVNWVGTIKGTAFTATALLPTGWTVHLNPINSFDKNDFTIADENNRSRATVRMKLAFYDQSAQVVFFPKGEDVKPNTAPYEEEFRGEFEALLTAYKRTLRFQQQFPGDDSAALVNQTLGALNAFVKKHPGFASRLPVSGTAADQDPREGVFKVINTQAAKGDNSCVIQ